jgi:hypothetical protein
MGSLEMNVMNSIANKKSENAVENSIKGKFPILEELLRTIDNMYGGYMQ